MDWISLSKESCTCFIRHPIELDIALCIFYFYYRYDVIIPIDPSSVTTLGVEPLWFLIISWLYFWTRTLFISSLRMKSVCGNTRLKQKQPWLSSTFSTTFFLRSSFLPVHMRRTLRSSSSNLTGFDRVDHQRWFVIRVYRVWLLEIHKAFIQTFYWSVNIFHCMCSDIRGTCPCEGSVLKWI